MKSGMVSTIAMYTFINILLYSTDILPIQVSQWHHHNDDLLNINCPSVVSRLETNLLV